MTAKKKAAAKKTAMRPLRGARGAGDYRLERVALEDVARWPRNPKRHDEPGIEASIKRFGFVQPVTLDEKTNRLVAGHGRLEALERMRAEGDAPPKNIAVDGKGRWLVPVIRGVSFESEDEAEAYLVADNRLGEAGGWDEEKLKEILKGLRTSLGDDVVVTGYSKADLDGMLAVPDTGVAPTSTHAPSISFQFSSESLRDEVKKAVGAAAGEKEITGDALARLLGVKGKRAKR